MADAFIGLGSNLAQPRQQLCRALAALAATAGIRLVTWSRLYRSAPHGVSEQPDFLNAVARLQTDLPAHRLLDVLLELERRQGRTRTGPRWGPRTLDLDLLVYGCCQIADDRLTVPHPWMARRNFVLVPLAEIAPQLEVPGHGRVSDLLAACPDAPVWPVTDERPDIGPVAGVS